MIRDLLSSAAKRLRSVGSTPLLDARLLLAHVLNCDTSWLLAHDEASLDEAASARFLALLERRAAGEPLAYVLGAWGFFGRAFSVNSAVLVPRPETEHLIEAVLDELRVSRGPLRVADIGTGSGAIAVTLACEMPELEVYATDVSSGALEVARENAQRLGARVTFLQGDLAAPLAAFAPLTCIAANLPYIKSLELPVAPNPVSYEPRVALDGGDDGLFLYRRLAAQLQGLLAPGAALFWEAAPDTIDPLAVLAEEAFPGAHVEIGEDYGGRERYVIVMLP